LIVALSIVLITGLPAIDGARATFADALFPPVARVAAQWVGTVEAPDEQTAIQTAAEQFKVPASKLMAVRRR
jgi:hypothetical protein